VHRIKDYERPGWMNIRDYCDGMILNWTTHLNDIAQWGNNTDRTGPVEVVGQGKFPPEGSLWDVCYEFEFTCTYANGVKLICKTDAPYKPTLAARISCRPSPCRSWIRRLAPMSCTSRCCTRSETFSTR